MKRFRLKVTREATYVEELDVVVSAETKERASEIAEQFGYGNMRDWPEVQRYTVADRHPMEYETLKVEHAEGQ